MKRITILISVISMLGICSASAQQNGSTVSKRIESSSIVELNSTLPVDVTLIDSDKARACAIMEIPSEVAQWIVWEIDGNELSIYPKHGEEANIKNLSADNPIKLRIESSKMRCINNTGHMRLTYKNRRLDSFEINNSGILLWNDNRLEIGRLEINNSGVFRVEANKITANTIEINNAGRYSCRVNTFYCENWEHNNSGVNDIESAVKSKTVECNSVGKEQLRLNVTCETLEVNSTGIGSMTFSGTADSIDVSSTGLTQISTSAVNSVKH